MATIQTTNLKDRIKNDTFSSVQFTFQDNLGAAIDLTGATIQIQFRFRSKTGSIVKDVAIGSGITVAAPATGVIVLDEFTPVDWAVDTYYYDVQITFATGVIRTYVQGTVKVLQDTTDS